MTKEIKENKVEITLEIFKNIRKMLKSSNDEDFFIAVKTWRNMSPSKTLSELLVKSIYLQDRSKLESELGITIEATWGEMYKNKNNKNLGDIEKEVFEYLFNDHLKQMLMFQSMSNINYKLQIQWEN